MAVEIAEGCGFVNHKSNIYGGGRGWKGADMYNQSELGMSQERFLLHCDNQSVIATYHSRTKHIHTWYHWLREKVDEEEFTLVKIHTDDNGSDMLTKNLPMDRLRVC